MRQIFIIGLLFFSLSRQLAAQEKTMAISITYSAKAITLGQVLDEISTKYNIRFFYSADKIPVNKKISIDLTNQPFENFLLKIKDLTEVNYKVKGQKVILFANKKKHIEKPIFSIFGFVEDSATGERLIGATILIKSQQKGTVTNAYGFYSLSLPKGKYIINCSSMGYTSSTKCIELEANTNLQVKLPTSLQQIEEINVSGKISDQKASKPPGSVQVTSKMLQTFPALFGENDPIQFLQMLPGIQYGSEGSTGLYVRGGTPGQTSFLLDDTPLFNISHISGFFSSINPDAIKEITVYKSHIPSRYSGALGSAIDIRLRDGNNQRFSASGGIGLMSSRLTIEGPIIKNKASFIVSARRSYLTELLQLVDPENSSELRNTYFYDIVSKINFSWNTRNRLYLSSYLSKDKYSDDEDGINWTNSMLSFRWNHVFSSKLFSNLTLTRNNYEHSYVYVLNKIEYFVRSKTQHAALKYDLFFYPKDKLKINFGFSTNYQAISPREIKTERSKQFISFENSGILDRSVYKLYTDVDFNLNHSLSTQIGFLLKYINNYSFSQLQPQLYPEPSVRFHYQFSPIFSMKSGYTYSTQSYFLENITNMLLPFDMLIFANDKKPSQYSNNFTLGWYFLPQNKQFEFSAEAYYKSLKNQQRFEMVDEFYQMGFNKDSIISGSSKAYGIEFSLKKHSGRLKGFISYTYSKVNRKEDQVFDGVTYNPFFDRPHHLTINACWQFTKKFSTMLAWTYMSGNLYNAPIGKYEINGISIPAFDQEQFYTRRMPANHHLDISLKWKFSSKGRYKHNLCLNFYNIYFQQNLQYYTFRDVYDNDIAKIDLVGIKSKKFSSLGFYIFQFVPAFSYEFKFSPK